MGIESVGGGYNSGALPAPIEGGLAKIRDAFAQRAQMREAMFLQNRQHAFDTFRQATDHEHAKSMQLAGFEHATNLLHLSQEHDVRMTGMKAASDAVLADQQSGLRRKEASQAFRYTKALNAQQNEAGLAKSQQEHVQGLERVTHEAGTAAGLIGSMANGRQVKTFNANGVSATFGAAPRKPAAKRTTKPRAQKPPQA